VRFELANDSIKAYAEEGAAYDSTLDRAEKESNSMKTETYVCPQCKQMVKLATRPKRSFMGFARIPCPTCKSEFRYPLTTGYVVFYWLLLLGNIAWLTYILSRGQGFVPNPIGIVVFIYVVISLVKNSTLKRSIAEAMETASNVPAVEVAVVEGEGKDRAQWYHLLIAFILPYVAFPWGIVNLCKKKKGSGLMLTITSAIMLLILFISIIFASRQ
jgi:ribosomal protein L37AE/L43A